MIEAPKFEPGQEVFYNGRQLKINCIHSRSTDDTEWYYSFNVGGSALKESELSSALPEDLQYLIIDPIPIPREHYFTTTSLKILFDSQEYTLKWPKWKIKETLDGR